MIIAPLFVGLLFFTNFFIWKIFCTFASKLNASLYMRGVYHESGASRSLFQSCLIMSVGMELVLWIREPFVKQMKQKFNFNKRESKINFIPLQRLC